MIYPVGSSPQLLPYGSMGNRYGRYEVLYKLGHGAMAEVHLARDPVLSRFVAVKVLKAELAARKDVLQRFFNEARTVAVVRNPHVVEVFDFGQEGADLYLVMEFVDGQSLHGILKQLRLPPGGSRERADAMPEGQLREQFALSEPLDAKVTAALMCQAAEGLSVAARHGVVHRDVKPGNLMINQQGYLKISDFGIAHVQDDSLTKTGAVLGSPLFMSPEQARGLKPITSQADMFSLGAVFYTCLAGHPPFRGRTFGELFHKIAVGPHTPLWRLRPDLDANLSHLVDTLLHKEPDRRGGGPKWLHRQLKGYLMTCGVADPEELVCGYLQQLSARGVQTTWRSEGATTTLARTRGTIRFTRDGRRKFPAAAAAIAVSLSGLLAGGLWHGMASKIGQARQGIPAVASNLGNIPATSAGSPPDAGPASAAPARPVPAVSGPASTGPMAADPKKPSLSRSGSGVANTENAAGVSARPGDQDNAVLLLQSSPPFAETYVDGRFVGVTPVRVDLQVDGRHRIVMKGKRNLAVDTAFILRAGMQSLKLKMGERTPARLAGGQSDAAD